MKTHNRRIFTPVSSHCTLITPQIAREVVGCGPDHLVCAIDGMNRPTYGMYRADGIWEKAIEGLTRIAEATRKIGSRTVVEWHLLVHGHNVHEIPAAKHPARKLGVIIRFAPLCGMEFNPTLRQYWKTTGLRADTPVGQPLHAWPCYFLWRSLVLKSNAMVARCSVYQNVPEYASIYDISILEAYNHPTVPRARRLFSKAHVPPGDFPAPCNNYSSYRRHHGAPPMDKPAFFRLGVGDSGRRRSRLPCRNFAHTAGRNKQNAGARRTIKQSLWLVLLYESDATGVRTKSLTDTLSWPCSVAAGIQT